MSIKTDVPQKRKNLINERKRRTYVDDEGIEHHWTQEYVAKLIEKKFGRKVSGALIGRIERGQLNGSYNIIKILSKLYDKSIEELMN